MVKGWPLKTGTTVTYCDGKFARAYGNGSDWVVNFHYDKGAWRAISPDGSSWPSDYPCFNSYKLRDMGAPEEFIRGALICKPNEIRR